ncbi:hypothetical protein ACFW2Y_14485 [Streptomyces sp. NPDC058877]|uniref:hypothetical protein n=1 Tax=Streptomyces sp. NPDC058877 TaxID=3346665 RepID=UPI0036D1A637
MVVEYGHIMMGWLIRNQREDIYARRVSHLPRQEQRALRKSFAFILEQDIRCVSLDSKKAQKGVDLLFAYSRTEGSNLKGDFRNSFNDMLILGTAMDLGYDLVTEDRELWKFSRRMLPITCELDGQLVRLKTQREQGGRQHSQESRGYVNRSWQVRARAAWT